MSPRPRTPENISRFACALPGGRRTVTTTSSSYTGVVFHILSPVILRVVHTTASDIHRKEARHALSVLPQHRHPSPRLPCLGRRILHPPPAQLPGLRQAVQHH